MLAACATDVVGPGDAGLADDAVANGGFEHGRARAGDDVLAGWYFPDTSFACDVVYDTAHPHTGRACLTLREVSFYAALAQEVHSPFLAGRRVRLRAFVRPRPNEVAWVALTAGGETISPAPVFLPGDEWSKIEYEVEVPAADNQVTVTCYATADASFDEVALMVPVSAREAGRLAGAREAFAAGVAALGAGPYGADARRPFQRAVALLAGYEDYAAFLAAQKFPYDRWAYYATLVGDYGRPASDAAMQFNFGFVPAGPGDPDEPFHLTLAWEGGQYDRSWVVGDRRFPYKGFTPASSFTHDLRDGRLSFAMTAEGRGDKYAEVAGTVVGTPWLEAGELTVLGRTYYAVGLWCYALAEGAVSAPGVDWAAGPGRAALYYAQYGTGEPFLLGPK